jgi:enamine deaminase RidA (YjgF/YER057c/UK114 family)
VTDGVEQSGRHRADETERIVRRRRDAERDLLRIGPSLQRRNEPIEESADDMDDDPNGFRRIEPDVEQARAARAARRELSGDPARAGLRRSQPEEKPARDAAVPRELRVFSRDAPRNRRMDAARDAEKDAEPSNGSSAGPPTKEPARESPRRLAPRVSRASRRKPEDDEDLLAWARPEASDPDDGGDAPTSAPARSKRPADPPSIGRQRGPATGRATVSGVASPAPTSGAGARSSTPDASATRARPARAIARMGRGGSGRPLAGEPEFIRRVNPFELPDPRGYAHATVAKGQLVFLAGQTGADLDGRIVDGGIVNQFDRAVQNLLIALAAAGGQAEHLAAVTVQVIDLDEYKTNSRPIGHVWRARLGGAFPALSLIEVRRFWDPLAEVQLDGHAVLP